MTVPGRRCLFLAHAGWLAGILLLAGWPVGGRGADELLPVCHNYACAGVSGMLVTADTGDHLEALFAGVADAASERVAMARAVGVLYMAARQQTPVFRDRAGNANDEGDGRMDCVDHAINTRTFLRHLEQRGLLRHHRVRPALAVRRQYLLWDHHATVVVERGGPGAHVFDAWYRSPGRQAWAVPLGDWLGGKEPEDG